MAPRNTSPVPTGSTTHSTASRTSACNAGTCGCKTCETYFSKSQYGLPQGAVCVRCVRAPEQTASTRVASSAASSNSVGTGAAASSTQSMRYKDLGFKKRLGVVLSLMGSA